MLQNQNSHNKVTVNVFKTSWFGCKHPPSQATQALHSQWPIAIQQNTSLVVVTETTAHHLTVHFSVEYNTVNRYTIHRVFNFTSLTIQDRLKYHTETTTLQQWHDHIQFLIWRYNISLCEAKSICIDLEWNRDLIYKYILPILPERKSLMRFGRQERFKRTYSLTRANTHHTRTGWIAHLHIKHLCRHMTPLHRR